MNVRAPISEETQVSQKHTAVTSHDRREFLKAGGAVTAALLAPSMLAAETQRTLPGLPSNPVTPKAMPARN
jgi:hypothetical protein